MNLKIANRLIDLRRQKNLTQEQLADKINVSRQTISKWERGETSPDSDNLIALAMLYGISLDYLLDIDCTNKQTESEYNGTQNAYNEEQEGFKFEPEFKDECHSKRENHNTNFTFEDNTGGSKINIGSQGIHIKDGNDEINISPFNLKISSLRDGISINPFQFKENDENGKVVINFGNTTKKTGKERVISIIFIVLTFLSVASYLLIGFIGKIWHPTWLLFFTPFVITSFIGLNRFRASFPLLILITFLALGFITNKWHPTWVIFLSIPLFYIIDGQIRRL